MRVTGYHRCGSGWHHIGAGGLRRDSRKRGRWDATQYGYTSVVDQVFSVPAGKTVGTFCRDATASQAVRRRHDRLERATGQSVRDQITIPAGYDKNDQMDTAIMRSVTAAGRHNDTLSTNLRAISDLVGLAGTVNIVAR